MSLAEAAAPLRERLAAAYELRRAARDAWPGDCYLCRDTGARPDGSPCSCERGLDLRAALAEQARWVQVAALEDSFLTPRTGGFSLDTFPDPDHPALREVRAFLDDWDGRTGLLLVGAYGTGKTGLLIGALRDVARRYAGTRRGIRLEVAPALYNRLRAGYQDGTYTATTEACQAASLLAIDDLGAERATGWVQEQTYGIVNHRYEHALPIWGTSNLGVGALPGHLGERTAWRVHEMCVVIDVAGPNWRAQRAD